MCLLVTATFSQTMDRIERGRMKDMLKIVRSEVKDKYYDPTFHGIDLEARFKQAEAKLDQATTTSQAMAVIAQVLVDLNDSHLFFIPPATNLNVEYGWRMQAFGDRVFVTEVKPGSDAEAKGLKRGDQILSIGGFQPSKKELWKVRYYYNLLSKRDRMMLTVISPGSESPRQLEIKSKIDKLPRNITFSTYFRIGEGNEHEDNYEHRFVTQEPVTIWKFRTFAFDPSQVNSLVDRAKKTRGLIIDLRGNGGGYVDTLENLVGNFFTTDLKIAELKGRKKMDPQESKTRGNSGYSGKLIVLVDSESGSAAEIFARVIQLEKRGQVLGDVSAGAVMQSMQHYQEMGTMSVVPFAISITNADVIMSDGKSLEHVGVIPDETIIPTGADLAARRDPVLARAVELLGGKITPEEAGLLFKYYWKD